MKMMLLFCGATLLLAGCASGPNPYASRTEFMYAYDMLPQPVPELTPVELDRINQVPAVPMAVSPGGAMIRQAGGSN